MTSLARSTIITSPQSHFCRAPKITFLSSTCAHFQIAKRPQSHLSQTPHKRAHNHRLQNAHNHISTETPHKCVCCGRLCFQQSIPKYNIFKQSIPKYNMARSRFKLNVSAGSQKRTIHEPEGKDESHLSLKSKRNRNVTIVKYILSLLGQIMSLLGQTNCVGLRTLCQKRLQGHYSQPQQPQGYSMSKQQKT